MWCWRENRNLTGRRTPGRLKRRRRLLLERQPVERSVTATLAQELVVAAGFDDQSVLDDENAIGVHDGGEPVRDDERRAVLAQLGDRLLHVVFGLRIERRGRLIEQDDRRVLDQRARDRDALALAAGELQAMLADRRIVAGGKAHDEIVRMRRLGGGDDLRLARVKLAECNVLADRAAEQVDDL